MSGLNPDSDSCALCKCKYSSTALNKNEKNKRRPIEKQSQQIYKIVKQLTGEGDSEHTCTYCRDVLRKLTKEYKVVDFQFPVEIEQAIIDGSLFPIRNLKRKGFTMMKRKASQAKTPNNLSPNTVESLEVTSTNQSIGHSSSPTSVNENHYFIDGMLDVDEGYVRKSALEKSLSAKSTESQTMEKEMPHTINKKRKIDDRSTLEINFVADGSVAKTAAVHGSSLLFIRLCDIYSKATLQGKSAVCVPEILDLWKIGKDPISFNHANLQCDSTMATAISSLLEFLHTGKGAEKNNPDNIRNVIEGRMVNDYVIGLMIIDSFQMSYPGCSDELKKDLRFGGAVSEFISLKEKRVAHHVIVMHFYEAIASNEQNWEEGLASDGNPDLGYFYYWLYHQVALFPKCSATQLLLKSLKICKSLNRNDEYMWMLHFIDQKTSEISNICIHSLLLMLLQNSDPDTVKSSRPRISVAFGKIRIAKEELLVLFKLLYHPVPVEESFTTSLQKVLPVDVVSVMLALEIDDPLALFFKDFEGKTPYTLKLAVSFFLRTGDLKYLTHILRDPFRYLTLDNVAMVEPHELKALIQLDELSLKEKQLYDFVILYSNLVGKSDDEKIGSTRNLLLTNVRYSLMTTEEFHAVSNDKFLEENDILTFWLHITSPIKPLISEKFWKPSVPRLTYDK